ncbi:transposase, partial [Chryseobacterium potabilaquae]
DRLRKIYNQDITKSVAMTKLAHWFKEVEEMGFKSFNTLTKTVMNHYRDILNYFEEVPMLQQSLLMRKSKTLDGN